MFTIRIHWIDGSAMWARCDEKTIGGYLNDWAVEKVEILFQNKGR